MIELFLLITIGKKVAAMLEAKGREPYNFVYLFAVLWAVFEFTGFVLASCLAPNFTEEVAGIAYLCGFAAGVVGGSIGYLIADLAAPDEKEMRRRFDDVDDEPPAAEIS
jgi:MFS family permease